ncbi:MAG: class II aldolase/adducin family protein [Acetobacteraceae bacterium]|nr:class II aldolase/adducin family protein [Acetobacteraceae bacterium]
MKYPESRYQVAIANRIMAAFGLASGLTASVGHASMRVPEAPDTFLIKGRGYELDILSELGPDDMVLCDLEGNKLEAPEGASQCYEVKMHSCIYRALPEIQSVVHAHPRFTILMSILGKTIRPMRNEGARLVQKPIPVYPHSKLILTDEDGSGVAETLKPHGKAALLKGHGAVTTGGNLEESVMNMVQLEEQAQLNAWAFSLMGADHPYTSDDLLAEAANQPPFWQVPHFQMSAPPARAPRGTGDFRGHGLWAYYVDMVSKDL